ncbi:MAG: NTP transferase domain-containing protein [Nitrospinae bacterium]|nr:NTP transferase domain-containing protein [Nitrospinota bacterium]
MSPAVVIMAAGKGTRMKSDLPKVLHELAGKPLLAHVIETARKLNPDRIVVIVGHGREQVMERFKGEGLLFATQEPQLGTGHAMMQARGALEGFHGPVVTLSGDVPLITEATLRAMLIAHRRADAAVTALTCEMDDPGSYGRIIRDRGRVIANVEAKDATAEQLAIREINSGVYVFDADFLFAALDTLTCDNTQREYYLTDLIAAAIRAGKVVEGARAEDLVEIMGVNTAAQLHFLEQRLDARRHRR